MLRMIALSPPFYCYERTAAGRAIADSLLEQGTERARFVQKVRGAVLSMLAEETLRAIHRLSSDCQNSILEVGAYIGGATLCILDATKNSDTHFVTIEEEVEHPHHPQMPTLNSIADLRKNVRDFGLERGSHRILAGASFENWVLGELHHQMFARRVGLLVWDADVAIDRDLIYFAPFLADDCVVVVDDYESDNAKSSRITATIDRWIGNGVLEPSAFLPWGTWFGRLRRKPSFDEVRAIENEWRAEAAEGNPYYRRVLDYRERLKGVGDIPALTMQERKDFWQSAERWSRQKK